jgi:hypothetical protein
MKEHIKLREDIWVNSLIQNFFSKATDIEELDNIINLFRDTLQITDKEIYNRLFFKTWDEIIKQICDKEQYKQLAEYIKNISTDDRLYKIRLLNTILDHIPDCEVIEFWNIIENLCDNYTLMRMLKKIESFEQAKTIFSTFKERMEIADTEIKYQNNTTIFNGLLQKAQTLNDIEECEQFFRDDILKDKELLELNDKYTQGILYNVLGKIAMNQNDSSAFEMMQKSLSKYKVEKRRDPQTIAPLINFAPDYETAYNLLYNEEGLKYINKEEQEMLQQSSYIVSTLFAANKFKQISKRRIKEVTDNAREFLENKLNKELFEKEDNILMQATYHHYLYKTFEQKKKFLNQIKQKYGIDKLYVLAKNAIKQYEWGIKNTPEKLNTIILNMIDIMPLNKVLEFIDQHEITINSEICRSCLHTSLYLFADIKKVLSKYNDTYNETHLYEILRLLTNKGKI